MQKRKVLLLNANGEPLSMIHWTRALGLLLKKKVDVYEYFEGEEIRSATRSFQLPSVIALVKYAVIPGSRRIGLNKKNVMARDKFECQYCGKHLSDSSATIDHILPLCRKGAHSWKNVVAACKPCNNTKDDRTPKEAEMPLIRQPWVPTRALLIRERAEQLGYTRWAPYFGRA